MGGDNGREIIWLDEETQQADRVWICLECLYATAHDPDVPELADRCMLCGSRMVLKRTIEAAQAEGSASPLSTQSKLTQF